MGKARPKKQTKRSPFGEMLIQLRTSCGLTQEALADATAGNRIATRSITNYERAVPHTKDWVLPHRSTLRLLTDAMDLDAVDQRALVNAWNSSVAIRNSGELQDSGEQTLDFITAGREEETASILEAWRRAALGIPQLVLVGGLSGIGKTSLMHHISDHIAAHHREVMISWGGASSWSTAVEPYLAMCAATDRILVAPEESSTFPGAYPSRPVLTEQHIERIMRSIPHLGGALISTRAMLDLAGQLEEPAATKLISLAAEISGTDTSGRQEEYIQLLVDLSKSWPILLVFDDVHWAGEATIQLLLHMAKQLQHMRDTPIMMVCTYRSNEIGPRDGSPASSMANLIAGLGHSQQITRVELNDTMARDSGMAFIHEVIHQTPPESEDETRALENWMYNQTSGHPLLTLELVNHLIEKKALRPQQDKHGWIYDPGNLPANLPPAIAPFMQHRLDRVSRTGRRILEVAAVMDDVILIEVIAMLLKLDVDEVTDIIDNELVRAHRLLLTGPPLRIANRDQVSYRFPHALFREHVYSSLSPSRRKRLHQAIAESMDNDSRDADSTALREITSHYSLAEDWHSAQMAGYRLAQDASIRLDWDLASTWFAQAEELALRAKDPHQLWRTRAARLSVIRGLGQYDEAVELGNRIIHLAETHNWPQTLALANHHLGEVYYDLGKIDRSVELLETAVALHKSNQDFDLAAAGEAMLSHATYRQGRYDVARKHAQVALELSREQMNSWVHPEAVLAQANCEIDLGFYEQAIENYHLSNELADMIGKLSNQYFPAINIGLCRVQLGQYDEAIEWLVALIDKIRAQRLFRLIHYTEQYLGMAYEGALQLDNAAIAYAHTSNARRSNSKSPLLYDSLAGQLRVAMLQGNDDLARACLGEITTYLENDNWEGIEDPLLVKVSVARGYAHFGDMDGYRTFISRAQALLMTRADLLEDEASRTSYLTRVPVNIDVQERFANL